MRSIRKRYAAWAPLALLLICPPSQADRQIEDACFESIQGRIAWNYDGDRNWNSENILRLCRGTRNPQQPGICFHRVMHGGLNWGGGTQWEWQNAMELCQGTSDANRTIGCFQEIVGRGAGWSRAVADCAGRQFGSVQGAQQRPQSCQQWVQGRIAWNYQGNREWTQGYLDRLCRGSRFPSEPGRCFDHVMHGGVDWGGGTQWEPDNALRLCAGSENAADTVGCFQDSIRRGQRWDAAIGRCARFR